MTRGRAFAVLARGDDCRVTTSLASSAIFVRQAATRHGSFLCVTLVTALIMPKSIDSLRSDVLDKQTHTRCDEISTRTRHSDLNDRWSIFG
jgi:hypothetical protein